MFIRVIHQVQLLKLDRKILHLWNLFLFFNNFFLLIFIVHLVVVLFKLDFLQLFDFLIYFFVFVKEFFYSNKGQL